MLLAFNTIITEKYKISFDEKTLPFIMNGFPYEIIHLGDDKLNDFRVDDKVFSKYTHLLVTGSSLSASQGSEFDEIIIKVIQYFIKIQKPILGICHGHQMLARAILGNSACRKAITPEFGWKKMQIKANSLFKGILNPVFLESHYDEVCNLPEEFIIIATNNECEVQAFQYKNLPVWGVQFHPEMQFENGTEMLQDHIKEYSHDKEFYRNELDTKLQIKQNFLIFKNFINSVK
ncbi:MAG: gamma-glutamyl-gamma-aminobutyrate hydrolase family protein [Candidatus Cloacimonetes bacterium]|nr:gamma-glutamyl-gamma-aminobutyrate hydrolase family protein [Candidatus Cloacimonadota bacterium]